MDKQQPQPKPQRETRTDRSYNMTRKEALDIIYEKCAQSKKEIRQGKCFTFEESLLRRELQFKKLAADGAAE